MEAMTKVVLCVNSTLGTRLIDCHDAIQTLIMQIVAFRQPTEYDSQMDMLKPHTQSHFKLAQPTTVRLTTITQDEGPTKSNASSVLPVSLIYKGANNTRQTETSCTNFNIYLA